MNNFTNSGKNSAQSGWWIEINKWKNWSNNDSVKISLVSQRLVVDDNRVGESMSWWSVGWLRTYRCVSGRWLVGWWRICWWVILGSWWPVVDLQMSWWLVGWWRICRWVDGLAVGVRWPVSGWLYFNTPLGSAIVANLFLAQKYLNFWKDETSFTSGNVIWEEKQSPVKITFQSRPS